jgi:hypothetical protein
MPPAPLTTVREIDAECDSMNLREALRLIARTGSTHEAAGVDHLVHVVVRLAESKRAWFITAAQQTAMGLLAVGFESGCIHSPARWFKLTPDFFDLAARANADQLQIDVLDPPTPLATIEDSSI